MEQLELMPRLKPALRRPVEPILRSAEIEGEYRWTLRRAWGAGPSLGITMLNPSDADGLRDDPTIWECMKHACRLGFGSIVVTNMYPFRSPSVPALAAWLKTCPTEAILANRLRVADALRPCEKIMFAWGAWPKRDAVEAFIEHLVIRLCGGNLDEPGPEIVFYCLGRTESGAPKHPLARGHHRIPRDQQLLEFKT